jgi:hypothetical protein
MNKKIEEVRVQVMSIERSQFDPAATQVAAPDLRLSVGVEEGVPSPPVERAITATPPSAGTGEPAGRDDAAPILLVALLQEYAVHHGPIAAIQRQRRGFHFPALVVGGGGGLVFALCAVWMVIDLVSGQGVARPPHSDPLWAPGMFFGGSIALIMGIAWLTMLVDERKLVAAGEAGKAEVMRRLLAAFPQLQGPRAEALLSGKAAQAIMAARERTGVVLSPGGTDDLPSVWPRP